MNNIQKTSILLYISALMLVSLACGISSAGTSLVNPTSELVGTQPAVLKMVVIADALNIRAEASYNSAADPVGLRKGEKVKVYLSCTGGEVREWVSLNRDCTRWVKAEWLH